MPKIFFTSDIHESHKNILHYCSRPYKDIREMNNALIKNWNSRINPEDTVYIAGDLSMKGSSEVENLKNFVNKLNGKKILIIGNHDRLKFYQYIDIGIHQVIYPYLEIKPGWYIFHDPALVTAIKDYEICLVGHVHDLFKEIPEKRILNVGVDVHNYFPIELEEVNEVIKKWSIEKKNV